MTTPGGTAFVDTSAFYALLDKDDANHRAVVELFKQATAQRWRLVTSNFVVAESHVLILVRLGRDAATAWLRAIPAEVVRASAEDEEAAKRIIFKYTDKEFSYCDAVSFALMERQKIKTALSMDKHFAQYGKFIILPSV